ncbi:MAG: Flp family type IVb pilin [Deltaproteobacteria bacterium]|nr:Flp family type IVb pilin [Deltaproteobacteria bacterium]
MKWILTSSDKLLFRFLRGVSGVSAIEYGILVLGVALTAAIAMHGLGGSLTDTWDEISDAVHDATHSGSGGPGDGIPPDFIGDDDIGFEAPSVGTSSSGHSTGKKGFPLWLWVLLWVLGLTGLAACLPLLYYIRRRHKEDRTQQENQIALK